MIGDILQPTHLLLILAVALLVLGPKRLPEAGRALGKGLRDFRSAVAGLTDDVRVEVPPAQSAPPLAPSQATPSAAEGAPTPPAPPAFEEPAITAEPATTPLTPYSVAAVPSFDEPVIPEPASPEPATPQPVTPQPVTPEPVTPEAVTPEPVTEDPAPSRGFVSPGIGTASRAARAEVEAAEPAEYAD